MNLKTSIRQTIAFFDLFDFPLTAEEILDNLYDFKKPVHIKEIQGTLEQMPEIEKIHEYYVIQGRNHLVDVRKAHKFIAEKWWGRVRQYGQYLVKVPFVKMIAVCNNLAYDNARETSDIDLFIVIEKGRIWTARLIITAILHFFGVRRYGDKITGRFCLSFFTTPGKMNMEPLLKKEHEDPYLGYWTKLIVPIYGKKTYQEFKLENQEWLEKKYGLKFTEPGNKAFPFPEHFKRKSFLEWVLKGWIGNGLEATIKFFFKKRTLKKKAQLGPLASVIVSDEILKFHNVDRRQEYFNQWIESINNMRKINQSHEAESTGIENHNQ